MTVRVYRWDDASAPTLNGTAGSLIAVLDACLVTGYGSKTASGWTKPYTGTNLAAFRQPTGSNLHYIRVDDTVAQSTMIRGYEAMTDVNTGTGPFPTVAQMANGAYYTKSSTADATARQWILVCNGPFFILYINYDNSATGSNGVPHVFGQITSYKSGDAYHTMLTGGTTSAFSSALLYGLSASISTAAQAGHYIARSYTQVGGSIGVNKGGDAYKGNGATTIGAGGTAYPSVVDGGLYMAPVFVSEPAIPAVRGLLPGVWNPQHNIPLVHLDTLSGTGALSGKTFLALRIYSSGMLLVETSDTW